MRVYLDTAHLAELDRLRQLHPGRARAFAARWRELGAVLVLSGTHVQEIGQLADQGSIQRRLEAVESLGSCVGSLGPGRLDALIHWELASEVLALDWCGLLTVPERRAMVGEAVFAPVLVRDVREFLRTARGRQVAETRELLGHVARADTLLKALHYDPKRPRDEPRLMGPDLPHELDEAILTGQRALPGESDDGFEPQEPPTPESLQGFRSATSRVVAA